MGRGSKLGHGDFDFDYVAARGLRVSQTHVVKAFRVEIFFK